MTGQSRKGRARLCTGCGRTHHRKVEFCTECEYTGKDLAQTGGYWLPDPRGILRWVS